MSDMAWLPPVETDPELRRENKLYQAEMLAHCLYGEPGMGFRLCNDVVQDGVMFLLAQLLTEAREAHKEFRVSQKVAS